MFIYDHMSSGGAYIEKTTNIITIIIIAYFIFVNLHPRNVCQRLGVPDEIKGTAHLRVQHNSTIGSGVKTMESDSIEKINELLELLSPYKLVLDLRYRPTTNYFDDKQSYAVSIRNTPPGSKPAGEDEFFPFIILDDTHMRLKSNYGITRYYKIIGDKLDLESLEKLYLDMNIIYNNR